MDIYEIANRSGLSLRSLRKLERLGVLDTGKEPAAEMSEFEKINYDLRKGNALNSIQLASLVEFPETVDRLGDYAGKAQVQIDALGQCQDEKASAAIVALVDRAAKDDPAAVLGLAEWLQSVIPSKGSVSHHYLAVRLLLGAGKSLRSYIAGRLPRAFLNCRNVEEFAGWSSVVERGTRRLTNYHRPTNYALDL